MTDITITDDEQLNEFEYTAEELAEIKALDNDNSDEETNDGVKSDDLEDADLKETQNSNNDNKENPDDALIDELLQNNDGEQNQDKDENLKIEANNPTQVNENNDTAVDIPDYSKEFEEIEQQKQEAKGNIDDVLNKIDELAEQFDSGIIGQGKYDAQRIRLQQELNQYQDSLKSIEQSELTLNTKAKESQNSLQEQWHKDFNSFASLPENKAIVSNIHIAEYFDETFNRLASSGMFNGISNIQALEQAKALTALKYPEINSFKSVEQDQANNNSGNKQTKKPVHDGANIPVSLSGMQALDTPDQVNPFAYLDKLSGIAHEEAISKLSPAQLDEYLSR